jgi:hypothetical protein
MEKRRLGGSGIEMPPLMFGGNVFGWTIDEAASFRLLDALIAAGFNAIDTADVYSVWVRGHQGGESETVIGNWLKRRGRRDDVIIATKLGSQMGSGEKGLSRAWIMKEVGCLPETAADRHHRSLSGASRRSRYAAGGDCAGVRRPREARQGACDRCIELHGSTP